MSRSLNLLTNQAITAAGTVTGDPVAGIENMSHLTFQSSLDWGSGGSTIKVFLQTTLDRGTTWFDIACIAHTTADSIKALSVSGGASSAAPPTFTDGSLADDTVLDGFIGDQLRVKVISTGTYASTLLDVDVVAKSGVSDKASITPGTSATALGKAEDAAHTSGDVGVMMLAVRNDTLSTIPTNTDRDYAAISVSDRGSLYVQLAGGAISDASTVIIGSSLANGGTAGQLLGAGTLLWDGAAWNRQRNNLDGTALASAARTASTNSADITNYNGRGVWVVFDATAASATPSVVLTVEGKDALSGKYVTLFTGAAVTGISTNTYLIYPGVTVAANVSVSAILPRTFRITVTHGDADSLTYSVGYSIIL